VRSATTRLRPRRGIVFYGSRLFARDRARYTLPVLMVYVLLVGLAVFAAIHSPKFLSLGNLLSLALESVVLGLAAIGQMVVMLTGGIDMSIGMVARVVGLGVAVLVVVEGWPILAGIALGLSVGVLIGVINATVIIKFRAVPFIVTLGMFGLLEGLSLAITTQAVGPVPDPFLAIYNSSFGPVPAPVAGMAIIWAAAYVALKSCGPGRSLYAVGGGQEVARLAGIDVNRTRCAAYAISGLLGAATGLFLLARSGVADPAMAANLEFDSIVAVALGGTSLFGGSGSVLGTLGAVLALTVLVDVVNIAQLNVYYQQVFEGLVILSAVALYKGRR
jgi:ribose transport system permease protein